MRVIGIVERLQVQRTSMKNRSHTYDLSSLVPAAAAMVEEGGMTAMTPSGDVLDVHHAGHPGSYCNNPARRLSVMTVADYERIRKKFGSHVANGTAGENILVDSAGPLLIDELDGRVMLRTDTGSHVLLTGMTAAAPCLAFARFVLDRNDADAVDEDVRSALRYLGSGTRGYYARVSGAAVITVGSQLVRD
jgi:MOSC domain-containing protein YiiM